jgi:hypothetical protein
MSSFGGTGSIVNDQIITIPVSLNINGNTIINTRKLKKMIKLSVGSNLEKYTY